MIVSLGRPSGFAMSDCATLQGKVTRGGPLCWIATRFSPSNTHRCSRFHSRRNPKAPDPVKNGLSQGLSGAEAILHRSTIREWLPFFRGEFDIRNTGRAL